ncbi:MAG: sterol desaturase family protein [Pseudomonadota bacterium]|jgi:sterol desaturase/sphingolipid hydroxylase (fatty acid hydroxylase superfamily)|uniref:Putative transmembrane protein n=1 Tax=Caballeronia sordidicola TaxID=196367 RepID=A0A242M8B3_CABSO|nr:MULTISPECIES: sterol desaturase family protein [Burkholderiaceae]AMM15655.1 fatty acid hydroxylase [Burkholderia sp. PAMC 28687]MDP9155728.1 sterol desaturase family protein [Pseudomonadota bacterium]OTP67142.1 putative transmembrane protein [Caballeronia sordidicola]
MVTEILAQLDNAVGSLQTLLYVDVVQPIFFKVGLMGYDEDTYDALYWVIIGALEVLATFAILRPLEALRPIETWQDRKAVRSDVFYTWIAKLGIINLAFFFLLTPVFNHWQSLMVIHGIPNLEVDSLWPGVTDQPVVSFVIYLIVLDFAGYWYHRWQHRFGVWWELHAVHHSQQQMSLWADDRNHFLDDIIQAAFFASISLFIGVEPSQFVVLVALSNVLQSIQHVNARLPFVPMLDRLLVSPTFHRRHHAIGYGHEGTRYGCNFGVLFPWWDMLFKTASWNRAVEPTGIRDQLPAPYGRGRDYGMGMWAQQWHAFARIAQRMRSE